MLLFQTSAQEGYSTKVKLGLWTSYKRGLLSDFLRVLSLSLASQQLAEPSTAEHFLKGTVLFFFLCCLYHASAPAMGGLFL